MKKLTNLIIVGIATMLVISSCTMQKRVYMPGYHVEWHNSKINKEKHGTSSEIIKENEQIQTQNFAQIKNDEKKVEASYLTSDNNLNASVENYVESPVDNNIIASVGDNIELTNNKPISYNKTANTKSIIDNAGNADKANENFVKKAKPFSFMKFNKIKKQSEKNASSSGGLSQLVALLLCIFGGALGIHRFYLGYIGIGILMLLTGGVCGVLAIIDLIRIITGDLQPNGGSYSKTL